MQLFGIGFESLDLHKGLFLGVELDTALFIECLNPNCASS